MAASTIPDSVKEGTATNPDWNLVISRDLKSLTMLGRGLSGIVYETTWKGKRYARKDFVRVEGNIFEEEARVLLGLHHANIVQTYWWTVDKRSCSLVLEYMDDDLSNVLQNRKSSKRKKEAGSAGPSNTSHVIDLQSFIQERKNLVGIHTRYVSEHTYPFELWEALHMILEIAKGMQFLHEKRVAHGDVKPKNILITDSEGVMSVKLADFGLLRTKQKSRLVSRQVRKLNLVQWKAPELFDMLLGRSMSDSNESSTDSETDNDEDIMANDTSLDNFPGTRLAMADVYSFAVTCSQILTGEEPYPRVSLKELMDGISSGSMRPELPPTCPPLLKSILHESWGVNHARPTFSSICKVLEYLQSSPLAGPSSEGLTVVRSDLRIDGERQCIPEDKEQDKPSSQGYSFEPTTSSQVELVKIWGKDDEDYSSVGDKNSRRNSLSASRSDEELTRKRQAISRKDVDIDLLRTGGLRKLSTPLKVLEFGKNLKEEDLTWSPWALPPGSTAGTYGEASSALYSVQFSPPSSPPLVRSYDEFGNIPSVTAPMGTHVIDIPLESAGDVPQATYQGRQVGSGAPVWELQIDRRSEAPGQGPQQHVVGIVNRQAQDSEVDSHSSDSDEGRVCLAKMEIDNIIWIRKTRRHKMALEEWVKKEELFAVRSDRKREQSLSVKNEIYQLLGFYSVFQGVLLTAVSQSNLLHCNNWWTAFSLSAFASCVTIGGVIQKVQIIWSLELTIHTENITRKLCVSRVQKLRYLGRRFRFHKDAQDGKGKLKSRLSLKVYFVVVIITLAFFSCTFLASIHQILCNPGYSLLPNAFP